MEHGQTWEYMTEKNIADFQCLMHKYWESYQKKEPDTPDQEWLEELFCSELAKPRKAKEYARDTISAIGAYQQNTDSLREAVRQGLSTGQWLSEKIQAASVGMAIDEYGRTLCMARDILCQKNMELAGNVREQDAPLYATVPDEGYSYYKTRDLIFSMERHASMIAVQTASVTAGLALAYQGFHGQKPASHGCGGSLLKIPAAGILQTAAQKGCFPFLPKKMPPGMAACICCAGIDNASVLGRVASGAVPAVKGIDQMGCHMLSLIGGTWDLAGKETVEALFLSWKSVLGTPLAILNGFLEGAAGYWNGMGEDVFHAGKETAQIAESIAKSGMKGIRPAGRETNHSRQVVSWIK